MTRKASVLAILLSAVFLLPFSASAFYGEDDWDYTWDDPVLYSYGGGYSNYGGYTPQYANAYQAYQPTYYQSTYQSYYQPSYNPQQQYGGGYSSGPNNIGFQNGPYGYGLYGGFSGYGLAGAYGNYGPGTPTGDYIPWLNEPICDYAGYGRGSCMYHPSQPLYDYWTGTWY